MKAAIRVPSRTNEALYAQAIPGHFATNHSHINYYIDMSDLKHSRKSAKEAAATFAAHYRDVQVDTILCLENTQYLGAYLGDEISADIPDNVNANREIFLLEPVNGSGGQLIFPDNLRHMVANRNVVILVSTASTGQTLSDAHSCVEYYGGRTAGFCALFSNIEMLLSIPVHHIFSGADFPHYENFSHTADCPQCRSKTPLDAIVTPQGYSKL